MYKEQHEMDANPVKFKPKPRKPRTSTMSIELPVDIGENTLKFSTSERLQETFVTIIEYLMTSENSPQEWIDFLSIDNNQTITLLSQSSVRLLELEIEQLQQNQSNNNDNNDDQQELDEDKEEEEEEDDFHKATALSLLCKILVMFGSLDTTKFCPIIMEHAYENILSSIKYHNKISYYYITYWHHQLTPKLYISHNIQNTLIQ